MNPKVLIWARETAGFTLSDVANRLDKDPDVLMAWEQGTLAPTYIQLEKLAYEIYKRPLAVFFASKLPKEDPTERAFRSLPGCEYERLQASTRFKLRDAIAYQNSLRELAGARSLSDAFLISSLGKKKANALDTVRLAKVVRELIGIPLSQQLKWRSADVAMKEWRLAVEKVGIYVFKTSLKQNEISGFCLYDEQFPIIVINNSTTFTRQIFTLFHELCHLILRENNISSLPTNEYGYLVDDRQEEVRCNEFASEFLVPSASFHTDGLVGLSVEDFVSIQAENYCVSREVILRRLRQLGKITDSTYRKHVKEWADNAKRKSASQKGGDHYNIKAAYLSPAYTHLAFKKYWQGHISEVDLASHLNMKIDGLPEIESRISGAF